MFRMYKFRTMWTGCSDRAHREYVAKLLTDPDGVAGAARAASTSSPRTIG